MTSHLTKNSVVPEEMGLNLKACRFFCVMVVLLYLNLEVEFVYSTTVNPYQPNSELHWTVCIVIPGPVSSSNRHIALPCFILVFPKPLPSSGCSSNSEDNKFFWNISKDRTIGHSVYPTHLC